MPCRHQLTTVERRQLLALNTVIIGLKLVELSVVIRAARRRREANKIAAAAAVALVEKHFPLKKENDHE